MSVAYTKIASSPIVNYPIKHLSLNHEGWSLVDVTGDGIRDLVITNTGNPSNAVSDEDPPITVLKGNPDYSFSLADTSALPPVGWVNDYIFLDSDDDGILEIVAIDHGRELAYDPIYWSQLWVYEYDPVSDAFIDKSAEPIGNSIGFYHNSSNSADLNLDGIPDFVVAQMGPTNLKIFKGNVEAVFVESTSSVLGNDYSVITNWNASKYVDLGAAGFVDIGGDDDYDIVGLPYIDAGYTRNQDSGLLLEFESGEMIGSSLFNVRDLGSSTLPDEWGYSYFSVEDLNNDGLQDIVAFAENPSNNAGGTGIFVSLIQSPSGEFTATPSFPDEPLITDRRGEIFVNNIWHDYQFSLEDLNGDGYVDLFWGIWFGANSQFFRDGIFLNDGSGQFIRATDSLVDLQGLTVIGWDTNGGARELMQDLNYDGIGDFVILESNWNESVEMITPVTYLSKNGKSELIKINGIRSQYEIKKTGEAFQVIDDLWFDGIIRVGAVKRIEFTDVNVALDLDGSAGLTARTLAAVIGKEGLSNKEYVGIGLQLFDAGQSLASVCELALTAVGATTNEDVVNLLYTNLYGEAPTAEVAQPFIDALNNGGLTKGSLAAAAAELTDDLGLIDLVGLAETGIEYV